MSPIDFNSSNTPHLSYSSLRQLENNITDNLNDLISVLDSGKEITCALTCISYQTDLTLSKDSSGKLQGRFSDENPGKAKNKKLPAKQQRIRESIQTCILNALEGLNPDKVSANEDDIDGDFSCSNTNEIRIEDFSSLELERALEQFEALDPENQMEKGISFYNPKTEARLEIKKSSSHSLSLYSDNIEDHVLRLIIEQLKEVKYLVDKLSDRTGDIFKITHSAIDLKSPSWAFWALNYFFPLPIKIFSSKIKRESLDSYGIILETKNDLSFKDSDSLCSLISALPPDLRVTECLFSQGRNETTYFNLNPDHSLEFRLENEFKYLNQVCKFLRPDFIRLNEGHLLLYPKLDTRGSLKLDLVIIPPVSQNEKSFLESILSKNDPHIIEDIFTLEDGEKQLLCHSNSSGVYSINSLDELGLFLKHLDCLPSFKSVQIRSKKIQLKPGMGFTRKSLDLCASFSCSAKVLDELQGVLHDFDWSLNTLYELENKTKTSKSELGFFTQGGKTFCLNNSLEACSALSILATNHIQRLNIDDKYFVEKCSDNSEAFKIVINSNKINEYKAHVAEIKTECYKSKIPLLFLENDQGDSCRVVENTYGMAFEDLENWSSQSIDFMFSLFENEGIALICSETPPTIPIKKTPQGIRVLYYPEQDTDQLIKATQKLLELNYPVEVYFDKIDDEKAQKLLIDLKTNFSSQPHFQINFCNKSSLRFGKTPQDPSELHFFSVKKGKWLEKIQTLLANCNYPVEKITFSDSIFDLEVFSTAWKIFDTPIKIPCSNDTSKFIIIEKNKDLSSVSLIVPDSIKPNEFEKLNKKLDAIEGMPEKRRLFFDSNHGPSLLGTYEDPFTLELHPFLEKDMMHFLFEKLEFLDLVQTQGSSKIQISLAYDKLSRDISIHKWGDTLYDPDSNISKLIKEQGYRIVNIHFNTECMYTLEDSILDPQHTQKPKLFLEHLSEDKLAAIFELLHLGKLKHLTYKANTRELSFCLDNAFIDKKGFSLFLETLSEAGIQVRSILAYTPQPFVGKSEAFFTQSPEREDLSPLSFSLVDRSGDPNYEPYKARSFEDLNFILNHSILPEKEVFKKRMLSKQKLIELACAKVLTNSDLRVFEGFDEVKKRKTLAKALALHLFAESALTSADCTGDAMLMFNPYIFSTFNERSPEQSLASFLIESEAGLFSADGLFRGASLTCDELKAHSLIHESLGLSKKNEFEIENTPENIDKAQNAINRIMNGLLASDNDLFLEELLDHLGSIIEEKYLPFFKAQITLPQASEAFNRVALFQERVLSHNNIESLLEDLSHKQAEHLVRLYPFFIRPDDTFRIQNPDDAFSDGLPLEELYNTPGLTLDMLALVGNENPLKIYSAVKKLLALKIFEESHFNIEILDEQANKNLERWSLHFKNAPPLISHVCIENGSIQHSTPHNLSRKDLALGQKNLSLFLAKKAWDELNLEEKKLFKEMLLFTPSLIAENHPLRHTLNSISDLSFPQIGPEREGHLKAIKDQPQEIMTKLQNTYQLFLEAQALMNPLVCLQEEQMRQLFTTIRNAPITPSSKDHKVKLEVSDPNGLLNMQDLSIPEPVTRAMETLVKNQQTHIEEQISIQATLKAEYLPPTLLRRLESIAPPTLSKEEKSNYLFNDQNHFSISESMTLSNSDLKQIFTPIDNHDPYMNNCFYCSILQAMLGVLKGAKIDKPLGDHTNALISALRSSITNYIRNHEDLFLERVQEDSSDSFSWASIAGITDEQVKNKMGLEEKRTYENLSGQNKKDFMLKAKKRYALNIRLSQIENDAFRVEDGGRIESWVTPVEIEIASEILGRPIHIYQGTTSQTSGFNFKPGPVQQFNGIIGQHPGPFSTPPICLVFLNNNHFNWLAATNFHKIIHDHGYLDGSGFQPPAAGP